MMICIHRVYIFLYPILLVLFLFIPDILSSGSLSTLTRPMLLTHFEKLLLLNCITDLWWIFSPVIHHIVYINWPLCLLDLLKVIVNVSITRMSVKLFDDELFLFRLWIRVYLAVK